MAQYGNWLGLLKWSLKQGQQGDGTIDRDDVTPMNEEDKAFLEAVMKECVKDEPTRMQEIIKRFTEILDAQEEEIADEELGFLLDELRDMIEQIDMSKVFTKFGGLTSVLMLLASNKCGSENREMAASVIGAIAQNNLEVQDEMYKMKTFHKLIDIFTDLTTDNYPMSIRAQCIYALSCVIRGHAAAEATFCNEYAQVVCHACLASKHSTLIRRIVFLCKALISSDTSDETRKQRLSGYLLPHILTCITCDDVDLREGTLLLLTSVVEKEKKNANDVFSSTSTIGKYKKEIEVALKARAECKIEDSEFSSQEESEQQLVKHLLSLL